MRIPPHHLVHGLPIGGPPDGWPLRGRCGNQSHLANAKRTAHTFPVLVFIDESGDPGFKTQRGSTPAFTAALVAFQDVEQARLSQEAITATAERLRVYPEFKFSKCRPEVRDAFFAAVLPYDFCVRAIVVRKEKLYSPHLRTNKESFYSFFVKSMLKYDGGLLSKAQIVIDGSGDREFKREIGAYFRRHLGAGRVRKIRFADSRSDPLVQLADMCVGAIARSYKGDRADAKRWREMLRPKIDDVWEFR
jgi:hypothetical protein